LYLYYINELNATRYSTWFPTSQTSPKLMIAFPSFTNTPSVK
jgi:hypothetical protein